MLQLLFISKEDACDLANSVHRTFYHIYNNKTQQLSGSKNILINILRTVEDIKNVDIPEGAAIEVFCLTGNRGYTITKEMFDLLSLVVERLTKAKITDCPITLIA
jgi:hypothetical protein